VPLALAATGYLTLVALGLYVAARDNRPFLWRRAGLLAAALYATGAVLSWWPWNAVRPVLDHAIAWSVTVLGA
jgi:hypothetical protein